MNRHRLKKPKKRIQAKLKGGLEKRKAGQGRLIFLRSTKKRILLSSFTDYYKSIGIDSS